MSHTGKHIKKSYRQLLYCHITAVRTQDDSDRKERKMQSLPSDLYA